MKTNKSLTIKLACIVLIILSQVACRSHKLLNHQHSGSSTLELTDDSLREQQNRSFSLIRTFRDSSDQLYQLTIFPIDTFNFSMERGFTGKAAKLELTGSIRQIRHVQDSAIVMTANDKVQTYNSIRKVDNEQVSRFRSVKRKGVSWVLIVCLVAVAVIGWYQMRIAGKV